MGKGKFVTAINCMDGRTQVPVAAYLKEKYGADYVDTITQPGPNLVLAANSDRHALDLIKKMLAISTNQHGSQLVALVGHADCAGNPADRDTQEQQIRQGLDLLRSWGINASLIGLWVDAEWQVHQV